jgi:hypothetical protein
MSGPYVLCYIFFVTYEWTLYAWVFLQPSVMEHTCLLVPFVSYEENSALCTAPVSFLNFLVHKHADDTTLYMCYPVIRLQWLSVITQNRWQKTHKMSGRYALCFIFLATYDWTLYAWVFPQPSVMQHTCLLVPFQTYE